MLDSTGAVKVMDFGIARAASDASSAMTQTAAVIGTAAYLSPEQARGETVDARSDLYSTGCLLYELVTGGPPFTGDNPVAVAYQHVREDPVPPSAYDESLSPSVDAVVLKAMAKNPANRYQSAGRDARRPAARGRRRAGRGDAGARRGAGARTRRRSSRRRPRRRTAAARAASRTGCSVWCSPGSSSASRCSCAGCSAPTQGLVPAPSLVGLTQRQAVAELQTAGPDGRHGRDALRRPSRSARCSSRARPRRSCCAPAAPSSWSCRKGARDDDRARRGRRPGPRHRRRRCSPSAS